MKALFICNQNKHRSKTAEYLFKDRFETKSAGLHNQKPVTAAELKWADIIFVMEEHQRSEIAKRFPKYYLQKRILSLDIPDRFQFNETPLVGCLQKQVNKFKDLL